MPSECSGRSEEPLSGEDREGREPRTLNPVRNLRRPQPLTRARLPDPPAAAVAAAGRSPRPPPEARPRQFRSPDRAPLAGSAARPEPDPRGHDIHAGSACAPRTLGRCGRASGRPAGAEP